MKMLFVILSFFSVNTLAGLNVSRCLGANSRGPIQVCFSDPGIRDTVYLNGEKYSFEMPSDEHKLEFALRDERAVFVQLLDTQPGLQALIQIEGEDSFTISCGKFKPGQCATSKEKL